MTTETFTSSMVGVVLPLRTGQSCDWSLTVNGSANMVLQTSADLDTWQTIESRTTSGSGSYVNVGADISIRWKCNSVSGSAVANLEV